MDQITVLGRVQTTCVFDAGVDAHVIPQHVCVQLGRPEPQQRLRGASGQHLGPIKAHGRSVVARDPRRCLLLNKYQGTAPT